MQKHWPLFLTLFGLLFVGVGVGIRHYMRRLQRRCPEMADTWRPVEARILSSEVATHLGGEGPPTYRAEIRYEYDVNGVRRVGDRNDVMHGWYDNDRRKHEERCGLYPAGGTVTAYYDPNDPSQVILVREFWIPGMMRLISVVFGVSGGAVVIVGLWMLLTRG